MKFLKKVFFVCFLLTVVFGGGLFLFAKFLPPDWFVSRDTVIDAPPARVFAIISDFSQWPKWSPWQQKDPAMKIMHTDQTSGAGAAQSWQSATQGSGTMTIDESYAPRFLRYTTQIHVPHYDGVFDGRFRIGRRQDGNSDLEWVASGKEERLLPKLVAQMLFDRYMGPDLEQGLASIKKLAETPSADQPAQPQ